MTLAHCDSAEGQQWSLTSNGVLMNGNGYCLQAGGPGAELLVGFDGQCDGGPGQRWAYHGTGGLFASDGGGTCAVLGGPLSPGTAVTSGACAGGTSWTFGAVVAPAHRVTPRPRTTPGRVVHAATAPPAAAARPDTTVWSGLPLAALLAGLLLVTGVTLVLLGRRSRRAAPSRPVPPPARGGAPHDSGPYLIDVTDEAARRRAAQKVVDTRPTEPFDVRSLP